MPVDETNLMKIGQDPFLCINPDSKKMSDTLVHNTEYYNKFKKKECQTKNLRRRQNDARLDNGLPYRL